LIAQGHATRRLRITVEVLLGLAGLALVAWSLLADRDWFERHVYWRYCAIDPKELAHARVERWVAAIVGLVVILFVRPRVGRWAARRTVRALLVLVAQVGLATILALFTCDYVLRHKKKPPESPPRLELPDSYQVPWYGWLHNPSRTKMLTYGTRQTSVCVDADGNRVRSADDVLDRSKPTIVFSGESITLGLGLDYADTYPAKVADALGVQSVNLSATGYGNDQAYLRVRDELPRLAKPIAVVTLMVPVQLVRNTDARRAHHVPREDGTIEEVAPDPQWWTTSPLRELFMNAVGYHSDDAIRVARATILATARDARAHGAYPLFMLTHWGPQCLPDASGAPSIERTLFDGLDVPHIRVDLDPSWWDAPSDHPDSRAHARMAEAIVSALRAQADVSSSIDRHP
jgi:hypothetical protein